MRFPSLLPLILAVPLVTGVLMASVLVSCASGTPESRVDAPLVEDKYRLSADRQALEEIRSEVPEDRRRENDELAFALQWMGETKKSPSEIREKFNSAVSKKRSQFQRDMEKRRETFVRKERADREAFQKEQESLRKDFRGRKATADERKPFFDDIEQKRRDFYADQREKRDAFEADMRDRRKNFDDYVREKTSEFNQEHRAYTRRYDDLKKEQEKARVEQAKKPTTSTVAPVNDEYQILDQKKGKPLGTEE